MTEILIVDDEKEIADMLAAFLENEGYRVQVAYTGKEALGHLDQAPPSLALLDVMLPDIDGFSLLRKIRETAFFPVLMLTAKSEDLDKITGLSLGADDYITKPFNPLEVVARVKTQLRRYQTYNQGAAVLNLQQLDEYDYNGLFVSKSSHKVALYGKEIKLTPLEFKILWYLCSHAGKVVSSETLFETVWGEKYLDNNNTVMAHIARLREKLHEPPRNPKFIKTVWGVGYTIEK
ncbi:VanR-ABDEGLN family response regulator transcription factor [Candidatus Enterococcus leclercqii]|uniref:VanR-ABDEGLN family response regulator transcription factor n=1 Tax=Candidatus Enterococcus leclercqii TaxID=1857218 RepID=UPI0013793C90|nr:VanR-ABDEGLN family response regulator transcription factor [Enterococcus sp. CU9D]KAF1290509.1 DNA-binding response regulator [Enterococcus sp. CU9D]